MTDRSSDVDVFWGVSPRKVIMKDSASPNNEFATQDIIDTLAVKQALIDALDDDRLSDNSGKEDLGGGVTVGLTSQLYDTQIGFESPPASVSSGTVTTQDTGGIVLIDNVADFVTDGVNPGDCIINFTDQSYTTVLKVDSPTQITCLHQLLDGTDNQFDSSDSYKVIPVKQCDMSGGNVVAVDTGDNPIPPVFPTAFTQVIRTSSSSATLQELESIQFSSYNGGVTIDLTSSYSGTTFPVGTLQAPVNNLNDALLIAVERGFNNLFIIGNITFESTDDISNYTLRGNHVDTVFTLNTPICVNTEFVFATLTGTLNGGNQRIWNCEIFDLTNFSGTINNSVFRGTIVLDGTETVDILNCYSGITGTGTPVIDMGGSGRNLGMRVYTGGIKIINLTGAESISIDFVSGQLKLDSTVTAGTLVIRGVGVISEDFSTGTTINSTGLINPGFVWDEQLSDHEETGSTGEALGTLKGRKLIPSP